MRDDDDSTLLSKKESFLLNSVPTLIRLNNALVADLPSSRTTPIKNWIQVVFSAFF